MKGSLAGWWRWAIIALLIYLGILWSGAILPVSPQGLWIRAGEYALWATVTLGALARFYPVLGPYGWRPVTIFLGAVLSGLEIFIGSGPDSKTRVDEWMTALIGIAVITILARVLPRAITVIWFGQEVQKREPFTRTPR